MRIRPAGAIALVVALRAAGPALAGSGVAPILGGSDVPEGQWRDAAGVVIDGAIRCSGVLVARDVVLTAGHCGTPAPTAVIVGTNDRSHPERGETLAVAATYIVPEFRQALDLTALVLATPSTIAPRPIASGWAGFDLVDGAAVTLVGFGAIDRDGTVYVDALQAADTTITDATCAADALGCNPGAWPGGELAAGGMGKDTCPGDSGGPLYLRTAHGDYVAGVTSRALSGAVHACEDGGIYTRPDAAIEWIEAVAGGPVARGPAPTAAPIQVARGDGGETSIAADDPVASAHAYAIAEPPAHGRAAVDGAGRVRYCADPDFVGRDVVGVDVADRATPKRHLVARVAVDVIDGTPPDACDPELAAGGCAAGRAGRGAAPPVVLVAAALVRRRRRR